MIDIEIILLILGGVLTVIGIVSHTNGRNLMNDGEKTEGVIHKFEKRTHSDYSSLYHPVIRFQTKNLEWITQELDSGTNPPLYKEGQRVTIMYDPKNPTRLDIFSPFRLKILPWILFGSGYNSFDN